MYPFLRDLKDPTAVVCCWDPPCAAGKGKPSKALTPGTFHSNFSLPAITGRQTRRSGFSACPWAADTAVLWMFAKARYFSNYLKTDIKLTRWTPCLVNGCLQSLKINKFVQSLWLSLITMGMAGLHLIQLPGQTSQADWSQQWTSFLVPQMHLLQPSKHQKGLSTFYLGFREM